jgi:Kef-type K+ transport system membrane component KefB
VNKQLDLAIAVSAALCVILATTTVCGRLAAKIGQPRVVGEIAAGVLLGPSLLGAIWPAVGRQLFTAEVRSVLYVLSTIGLTFFMFLVGASLDHTHLNRRSVRRAATLAAAGILPPFVLGAALAYLLAARLIEPDASRGQFMLFLGSALSITAFPTLARILDERGMTHTRLGGVTLVAAAVDDAAAWGLLALIIALAASGDPADALVTVLAGAAFAAVMLTAGRWFLGRLARRVERDGGMSHGVTVLILLLVLGAGWFTDAVGVFSVFGGFITGLAVPQHARFRQELGVRLTTVNSVLLLPVFFAFSGLNTELLGLRADALVPLAAVMLVAFAGKYAGCTITLRVQGMSWRYASAIGGLMNARGLMLLIFINIGLAYGLVTPELFAMLVVVAIVTTAAATPVYRLSLSAAMEEAERRSGDPVQPAGRLVRSGAAPVSGRD